MCSKARRQRILCPLDKNWSVALVETERPWLAHSGEQRTDVVEGSGCFGWSSLIGAVVSGALAKNMKDPK
jgi:hypothetical protein